MAFMEAMMACCCVGRDASGSGSPLAVVLSGLVHDAYGWCQWGITLLWVSKCLEHQTADGQSGGGPVKAWDQWLVQ